MIPQELLDILVCPECKQPLAYRPQSDTLKCGQCHRVYPVRDNIPVLLLDQATVED
jgi:LSD1 subclass zinc finger protein